MRDGLQLAATRQGHTVAAVATGEQGLAQVHEDAWDVVVLDLMLPGRDGFEICPRIRSLGDLPIIMLTASNDDIDITVGLEAGTDDVVNPVRARVLEVRILRWGQIQRRSATSTPAWNRLFASRRRIRSWTVRRTVRSESWSWRPIASSVRPWRSSRRIATV